MIDKLAERIFGWLDNQLDKVPDGFFPLVVLVGFVATLIVIVSVVVASFI